MHLDRRMSALALGLMFLAVSVASTIWFLEPALRYPDGSIAAQCDQTPFLNKYFSAEEAGSFELRTEPLWLWPGWRLLVAAPWLFENFGPEEWAHEPAPFLHFSASLAGGLEEFLQTVAGATPVTE